ncbi:MAG: hypothetical protein ABIK09_00180 [Pseudomonadota bacterium]
MVRILLIALLVGGVPAVPPARADQPVSRYAFEAALGRPVETATSSDGRIAWIVAGEAGHRLYVDGVVIEEAAGIEQVQWTRSGELTYWVRTARGARVIWGARRGRAWDAIRTPDLAVLGRADNPSSWSWSDRGGASMTFASRDPRDPTQWVRLTRRPSQPADLERSPLTTNRVLRGDPDPGASRSMALRYHLVAGRVPAYVALRGSEECLVVGAREMACGARIEMIASAPHTGRLLVAWREREGGDLSLSDGLETTGPWRRIDWVSFSADGLRYAVMVSDRAGDRIQTDHGTTGSLGRLAALAHLSDGALATLWFQGERTVLLADDRVIVEGGPVTRFLRPPSGDPIPIIRDPEGDRIGADADGPRFREIWGEGFLGDGRFTAQVTPLEGGQGVVAGASLLAKGDALTWFVPSADGTRVLSVFHDRATGREDVLLDGRVVFQTDEVTGLGFVGEGAVARSWVLGRGVGGECLWTSLAVAGLCCEAPLGWTGAPAAPVLVCNGSKGPSTITLEGEPTHVDVLPQEFTVVGPDGRILWYVTRNGALWQLHGADGRTEPIPGEPRLLLPGPDAEDHPRLLVQTAEGQGWFSGREGDRFLAEIAELPHEIDELGPVYAARSDGQVRWIAPSFVTAKVDALGSAPHPSSRGLSWWERRGDRWHWVTWLIDVGD